MRRYWSTGSAWCQLRLDDTQGVVDQDALSLMVLCCCTRSSSPSRMLRRLSATLATTCWHEDSSLARSSACCTRASRVPILKLGMAKGCVWPLSVPMVLRKASRASSWWWEGDIDVGNDTSRYFVSLDMFVAGGQLSVDGAACVEVSLVGLP